ncbi:type II toxin-antitoxin system prevent-host-death family antitoxin [Patulibacter sp. NPDC049589]|uniref:type II toxin-antitoxin system Phd/YefM family antitoxin n=1 Tax=Patulibacter sp. NPDC049589 TaxID=3154731 RepID=UPI003433639A
MRIGIAEAKTQLSKLVARAEAGDEVVITRAGRPAVRLVPEPARRPISEAFGSLRGEIWMADDFNEFGEDLQRDFGLLDDE